MVEPYIMSRTTGINGKKGKGGDVRNRTWSTVGTSRGGGYHALRLEKRGHGVFKIGAGEGGVEYQTRSKNEAGSEHASPVH